MPHEYATILAIVLRASILTLPTSYKEEAEQYIWEEAATRGASVALDYFIGGLSYRARSLILGIGTIKAQSRHFMESR